MAQRKKPETKPQLDASARAVPEDRPALGKETKPKTEREVQSRIDRAVEKIAADNEFVSTTGVRVNVAALKGLCVDGSRARRDELLEHVDATLDRLGAKKTGGAPFGRGKGAANHPGIHDLLRWLAAIGPEDSGDIDLLRRCRATLIK